MLKAIQLQYKNPGIKFLIHVIVLFLLWEILYRNLIIDSWFSIGLCNILGYSAQYFLNLLDFPLMWKNQTIFFNKTPLLYVGVPCNGLDFIGLFTCFVLAFPAPNISKIKFLFTGILIIHLLNSVRVLFLILNVYYFEDSFDFNHKVTFNVLIYGVLLILWMTWAKKQISRYEHANI